MAEDDGPMEVSARGFRSEDRTKSAKLFDIYAQYLSARPRSRRVTAHRDSRGRETILGSGCPPCRIQAGQSGGSSIEAICSRSSRIRSCQ